MADTDPSEDTATDTGGDTGEGDGYDDTRDTIRQRIRMALRTGLASGAQVAVWKDGAIVFSEGVGTRDPDTEDPVLTTTLFGIGSDAKKLTAITLLQQVDAGSATLDSTVADVLPDFDLVASPDWAGTTTLHELISHQGAIVDYTPWDDVPSDDELSARAYGRLAPDGWAMMPSGIAYNYSNPNFILSGLAVETLTGRPWARVLTDDVLGPLGLDRTYTYEADVEADGDYAIGYGYYLTEPDETLYPLEEPMPFAEGRTPLELVPENGFTRPAGMVWSTAEQMAALIAFLMDGNPAVLSDDMRTRMTTMHVPFYPGGTGQGYGYGVMVFPLGFGGPSGWHEGPYWTHGGNTLSYTSTWCARPEDGVVVAILSNGYGDAMKEACVYGLEGFADLGEGGEVPAFLGEVGELSQYVGTWYDPHTVGTIEVTTDGGELSVSMPDLEAAGISVGDSLTMYGENVGTVSLFGQPYELTWYDGPAGEKQYLVDRLFAAERVTDVAAARPAPRHPERFRMPQLDRLPVFEGR